MRTTTTMTLTTMTETTADSPDPSDGDSSPAAVTRQTNVNDFTHYHRHPQRYKRSEKNVSVQQPD